MNITYNKTGSFNISCNEEILQILRFACIALNEIGIWSHVKKENLADHEIDRDGEIREKTRYLIDNIQKTLIEKSYESNRKNN